MSADDDLDLRLRHGLRAAAEALPPSRLGGAPPTGGHRPRNGPSRRRLTVAAAAAVLVATAASVGITALDGDGDDTPDLQVAQTTSTPETTIADPGPTVDPVPGSAVVVGTELVAFGPDGQPGESLSLAPLIDVQAVTSDRHGGWIACGSTPAPEDLPPTGQPTTTVTAVEPFETTTTTTPSGQPLPSAPPTAPPSTAPDGGPTGPTTTVTAEGSPVTTATVPPTTQTSPTVTILGSDEARQAEVDQSDGAPDQAGDGHVPDETANTFWFRSGQDPEPLPTSAMCVADSLGVTEVDGQTVLVYVAGDISFHQLDLVAGTDSALPVPAPFGPGQASVGGGRLAVLSDAGLEVRDLTTGEPVAIGPVDLPVRAPGAIEGLLTSDLVLSPDGTRLTALVGDISASSEVVVVDLGSGTELFRHEVPVSLEGAEVAFDGTTVAVGSYYDSYGPVRIYDIAAGTERTVDAHGLLP